ncbi:putative permease [Gottschalkia purinilytica]|uniref:Putative permease n=1 Tax=Gottschalkia purinilytica TaxID=1503 RepID=A0A0L0WBJ3_GOTPU|nr:AI-2E family transporter [Gottschalkia purinilytica]KNF08851.1 putative permease [Gottschalkia purinilytica]
MKRLFVYIGYSILITLISYFVYVHMFNLIFPFLLAYIFSIMLEPIVSIISEKFKMETGYATIFILTGVTILLVTLCYILMYNIFTESMKLIDNLPYIIEKATDYLENKVYYFNIQSSINIDMVSLLKDNVLKLSTEILNILNFVRKYLLDLLYSFPKIIIFWIIVYSTTYFLLKDKDRYVNKYLNYNDKYITIINKIKNNLITTLNKLILGELIIILLSVIITIVGFKILNMKYSIIMGILTGLLDFIPFIGPAIIYIPWIAYLIISGAIYKAIGLGILFIILILIRQILQIKLLNMQFKIHPIIMLISIYIGIEIFGATGIIIGPIIIIFIKETIGYIVV